MSQSLNESGALDAPGGGDAYASLRRNVSMLGSLLGEVIASAEGEGFLASVESIRRLSRSSRDGDSDDRDRLIAALHGLPAEDMLSVARAFSQFLNLANIADQQHSVSREMAEQFSPSSMLADMVDELLTADFDPAGIAQSVDALSIELVLTAHPTEIMRRTLIHKHREIGRCLSDLELSGRTEAERERLQQRLRELVSQIWFGEEFRAERPTPVDEAKWGFAVVEDSLWNAVPEFLRHLDRARHRACGEGLPLDASPVRFLSWMGGDRDGNPNVTARVTEEVLLLARWQAADLYLRDIDDLVEELSVTRCDARLRARNPDVREPYRAELRKVRHLLRATLRHLEAVLAGEAPATPADDGWLHHEDQLREPLLCCYESLMACGMEAIAQSRLLDAMRRVACFGVHLVRLDIRQDSARHTEALAEITRHLGMGDYASWSEQQRLEFLVTELSGRRPLLPADWRGSDAAQEVLDTCRTLAAQSPASLGVYVISMAREASDVLAVNLLLRESGCAHPLPVVPLFETLDDLSNASRVVEGLLQIPWYRDHVDGRMMVMIGYSDSAKDAGVFAAAWAQYQAQESLLSVCRTNGIELTLFHGRGGTIGRGGAPAYDALLSQPPGSLRNGLRVTEQGEMIRAKLGLTSIAVRTLALYASAICRTNLISPPRPKQAWRESMNDIAETSCAAYRAVVREHPDFVAYFRHATPEQELGSLPLGSRPARRAGGGGIESLRAIPWIFAWSQNRLMLPAWLGAGSALRQALAGGHAQAIAEMAREWPFFATRLAMLEMVFAKADSGLSAHYDANLVPDALRGIGRTLREEMAADRDTVMSLLGVESLLQDQEWAAESIALRNVYTDPLNYLQVELLSRTRQTADPLAQRAMMVTIAGIAAGMRNTG
ncbi:MAG: phosphoenolpyruvate carboxylase [Chromatocurvus sp.]